MGNTSINSIGETVEQIYKEYKQVRKQNNGVLLSHLETGETYFLRETNYARKIDYQKELQRLQKQIQKEENQNIIKIVKYWGKQYNNFCSNSYKVYSVYESPEITLFDEVAARQKEQRFFEQCDLWSILQSCTKALVDLKPTMSVEPSKIYIQADGLLKVAHNDMTDDEYRCIVNQKVYYAPEKIANFNQPDQINSLQKETVFSMGMTMLHVSLLQDVHELYDYKNSLFHQQELEESLSALHQRYTQQYIEILTMILETNPNKRPSLIEVHQILEEKFPYQEQGNENSYVKPEGQAVDLKEFQTVEACENNHERKTYETKIKNQQIKLAPLGQFKNDVRVFQTGKNNEYYVNRVAFQPPRQTQTNISSNYILPNQSKQNIFTDPKLLEMIRNDLKQINSIKKSSFFQQTFNFDASKKNTYISQNNYVSNQNYSRTSLGPMEFATSVTQSRRKLNDRSSSQLETSNHQANISQKASFNSSKRLLQQIQNQEDQVLRSQPVYQNQQPRIISVPTGKNSKIPLFTNQNYEDGRYFQGIMVNGVKEGHGKMVYSEGSYYQGNFKNDKMHGQGVLYYQQDKPAYEGNWNEDQFHGKGILYSQCPAELEEAFDYSDFNSVQDFWVKYEGNFINDNKCGTGRLYLSNGQIFTGNFQNDCINGQGEFKNMYGEVIKGIWRNNNLTQILDQ